MFSMGGAAIVAGMIRSTSSRITTCTIGDEIKIRYFACDDVECTGYSEVSQRLEVLENFDADGDGIIGSTDFAAWRPYLDSTTLEWFAKVFGRNVVNEIYIQ